MRHRSIPWILVLLVVAGVCLACAAGCDDPIAALTSLTGESSLAEGHTHRATIPLADIESPPAGGLDYTSGTNAGHAHTLRLSEQQLRDLQQDGAVVSVTSSRRPPNDHAHVFRFER